jgi:hypothetical protein
MGKTKYLRCFPLVLLSMGPYGVDAAVVATGEITVSYLVPSTAITLHEPIVWRFQVHNASPVPVQLDLGKNRNENFIVSYTGPQGESAQARLQKGGFGVAGMVSVAPGTTYQQDILLNQWVSFTQPGKYQIEIRLLTPPTTTQETSTVEARAFRTTIEILPPDSKHLREVCDALAQRVQDARSYQKAADAALALSFVRDPVAVPYLQRVLYAKQLVEPTAIEGLEQIGNEDAARVLVDALNRVPSDVALIVRAALERMEKRISDPRLKTLIQKSLDG